MFDSEKTLESILEVIGIFRIEHMEVRHNSLSPKQISYNISTGDNHLSPVEEIIKIIYFLTDEQYIEKVEINLYNLSYHELALKLAEKEKAVLIHKGRVLGDFRGLFKKVETERHIPEPKKSFEINTDKFDQKKIEEIKNNILNEINEIEKGVWDVYKKDTFSVSDVKKIIQATVTTTLIMTLQQLNLEEPNDY